MPNLRKLNKTLELTRSRKITQPHQNIDLVKGPSAHLFSSKKIGKKISLRIFSHTKVLILNRSPDIKDHHPLGEDQEEVLDFNRWSKND